MLPRVVAASRVDRLTVVEVVCQNFARTRAPRLVGHDALEVPIVTAPKAPAGLAAGGRNLWKSITEAHDLDAAQKVQLAEACRAKDRLDRLDEILRGDTETWATIVHNARTEDYELKIDQALSQANATANLMKQLIAALRLPDVQTGQRPQYRGPRGAQKPSVAGGSKVSSLDRARAAKSGS